MVGSMRPVLIAMASGTFATAKTKSVILIRRYDRCKESSPAIPRVPQPCNCRCPDPFQRANVIDRLKSPELNGVPGPVEWSGLPQPQRVAAEEALFESPDPIAWVGRHAAEIITTPSVAAQPIHRVPVKQVGCSRISAIDRCRAEKEEPGISKRRVDDGRMVDSLRAGDGDAQPLSRRKSSLDSFELAWRYKGMESLPPRHFAMEVRYAVE